jgi:hypothetical protein
MSFVKIPNDCVQADLRNIDNFVAAKALNYNKVSLPITPSEVKSPLRAVRKRPERAVLDIFLRVG